MKPSLSVEETQLRIKTGGQKRYAYIIYIYPISFLKKIGTIIETVLDIDFLPYQFGLVVFWGDISSGFSKERIEKKIKR